MNSLNNEDVVRALAGMDVDRVGLLGLWVALLDNPEEFLKKPNAAALLAALKEVVPFLHAKRGRDLMELALCLGSYCDRKMDGRELGEDHLAYIDAHLGCFRRKLVQPSVLNEWSKAA